MERDRLGPSGGATGGTEAPDNSEAAAGEASTEANAGSDNDDNSGDSGDHDDHDDSDNGHDCDQGNSGQNGEAGGVNGVNGDNETSDDTDQHDDDQQVFGSGVPNHNDFPVYLAAGDTPPVMPGISVEDVLTSSYQDVIWRELSREVEVLATTKRQQLSLSCFQEAHKKLDI